jgi:broad specificity phosphatase PhoE
MLIFLVRHAESVWNRQKKLQGQKDPALSPYGREEAKRLARRFKGLKFAAAYSSPLKRAYETAEIIRGKRAKIVREEGLKEIGLGSWEGRTVSQIRKTYGDAFRQWALRPSRVTVPNGEDFKDFVARVRSTLRSIERKHREGNVLVVCHGGVISTYVTQVLHLPPDDVWCLAVKNASLTIVNAGPGIHKIVTFNDIGHLMSLKEMKPKKTEISHVA